MGKMLCDNNQPHCECSYIKFCDVRLLALFAGHRTELHRVAAYLVSDYANWVKKVTLPPAVKVSCGSYQLQEVCSDLLRK